MYELYSAKRKDLVKDTSLYNDYGDTRDNFYLLSESSVYTENPRKIFCRAFCFMKNDNEEYRICEIGDFLMDEWEYNNVKWRENRLFEQWLPKIMKMDFPDSPYCGGCYLNAGDCYDYELIAESENMEDIKNLQLGVKLPFFEEYVPTKQVDYTVEIKNNSSLTDEQLSGVVDAMALTKKAVDMRLAEYDASKIYNISIWYKLKFYDENGECIDRFNDRYTSWNCRECCLHADTQFVDYLKTYFFVNEWPKNAKSYIAHDDSISMNKAYSRKFTYVSATDSSISFSALEIKYTFEDNKEKISVKELSKFYYSFQNGKSCVKVMAKENKEISPFTMFNINSKTIKRPDALFLYEDALNIHDFFLKNRAFFEKIGFVKFIGAYKEQMQMDACLILFMSLLYEYPSVELLVKMGHTNLIEGVFHKLISCKREDLIDEKVKELDQLIDNNTSKGSQVLRIPSYIEQYLIDNRSSFKEYLFWRDMYEITHISKEQFEEFLNMPQTMILKSELHEEEDASDRYAFYRGVGWYELDLQSIVKHDGYTLNKTIKYVVDQFIKLSGNTVAPNHKSNRVIYNVKTMIDVLRDTLDMAEQLDVDMEKYPDNLIEIHDELMTVKQNYINSQANVIVDNVATDSESYLEKLFASDSPTLPVKAMEKYTYVFPHTQKDFIQEGISQNNCVASYYHRVIDGKCIIFFIRKKDSQDSSYITAEITEGNRDGQVMYSNNRPVFPSSLEYQYYRFIAGKLVEAAGKGKIRALKNILKK